MKDVTGETPGISDYLGFDFYDHISYKENSGLGMKAIRRRMGVSHMVGGNVPYRILTRKRKVISRTTFQRLTSLEKETDKINAIGSEFNT